MDFFYAYNYNEWNNLEGKRLASDAGFVDEAGSAVPLPEELTKMFKPLECELCGVIVTSEATAYTHYEGKVHIKNVNAYMKEQYNIYGSMIKRSKIEFTPHLCEVCKCELSSLIQAQQHYSGKVHKKNLRKINYDPQTAMAIQPILQDDNLGSDLLKDLPPPPPPPVLSDFVCEICNITTNTEYQLIVHKNGAKHKKKVKKLKESFGECGTDGFGYYKEEILPDNSCSGQLLYSIPEPIVTEYLPLSNEPLHFKNPCNSSGLLETTENNEESGQSGALCIKWFNDKTEALPKRPLEEAWVETFAKNEKDLSDTYPAQAAQLSTIPKNTVSSSIIRTYEASPEVAKLPQFSVAAVLPRLQSPPSPPVTLMSNALFNDPVEEEVPGDGAPSLDPPKINFRVPRSRSKDQQSNEGSSSLMLESVQIEKEGDHTDLNKSVSDAPSRGAESPSSPRAGSSPKKQTPVIPKQYNMKLSNTGDLSKLKTPQINNVEKTGKFITTNWEISQDTNNDNENQKKKKGVNFLLGFKKELDKKKTVDMKNLEGNIKEENDSEKKEDQNDRIGAGVVSNKEKNGVIENTKTDKSLSYKERDTVSDTLSDLRHDEVRKRHSHNRIEESKYSKDKSYKKRRKDRNGRDSHEYYRNKDNHRKHKENRKHRDDYDRYGDSDEDYRYEKRKHSHSSKEEKGNHRNSESKKPSLAQSFVQKTSTKHSIVSYLAPPSDFDSKDIAMYRTPSGLYYCTTCDYKSKHSSEFTDHLYNRSHKEKKKKTK